MADEVNRSDPAHVPVRTGVWWSELIGRISWGAVWSGVIVALGMEALFTLFGLFIGFSMYNWQSPNPWSGISAWITIWYLVTAGWSMFFGAWCAARLSGSPERGAGVLHGMTTWGLASIATLAVVLVMSWSVLSEGINVLRTVALTGAQVAPVAVNQTPPPQISQTAGQASRIVNQLQQNAGPVAQATADIISGMSLRVWGGLMLGFITAVIGGLAGPSRRVAVETGQAPAAPSRIAA
jgi:hypothetical protein